MEGRGDKDGERERKRERYGEGRTDIVMKK